MGQGKRPHADADGLLALQLRRAAGGQDRPERSHPEDRPVRQVGDALGLHADSGREDAGGGEADARQVGARAGHKPYLRFSTEGQGGTDPGDETEAVGDGDAVEGTALGIKNLARVSEMLMKATNYKTGDPWDELEEVYGRMVGQWTTEMGHVVHSSAASIPAETHRPGRPALRDRREDATAGGHNRLIQLLTRRCSVKRYALPVTTNDKITAIDSGDGRRRFYRLQLHIALAGARRFAAW